VCLLCLKPLFSGVTAKIDSMREKYGRLLEETTGLAVRYESFSPSLFFAARVKSLELLDAQSGARIVLVKSASLSYNVWKILSGDFDTALKKLKLRGVEFDAEALANCAAKEKILPLLTRGFGEKSGDVNLTFPFDIEIKSFSVITGSLIPAHNTLVVKSLALTRESGGWTKMLAKGTALVNPNREMTGKLPAQLREEIEQFSFSFLIDGRISRSLLDSFATVRFSALKLKNTEFKKLDFWAEYFESGIRISQVANGGYGAANGSSYSAPLDLVCDISVPVKTVRVRMRADSFDPLASVSKRSAVVAKFAGTRISGDYELTWTKDGESAGGVDYKAVGRIVFPFHAMLGKIAGDFSVAGDLNRVRAQRLRLFSEKLDAAFDGGVLLKKKQLFGQAEIRRFELPNGNEMSAELYFDPRDEGFLCFVPQLFFGESSFTALQLAVIPNGSSFDFSFELSDYSHYEFDEPGILKMEGSLLARNEATGQPAFAQTYVSVQNFFLDSVINAAAFFLSEQAASRLTGAAEFAAPYMITNEMFVSTDFSSFTYNIPYSIVANTRRDRNFVLFAADGGKTALHITRFDLAQGGQSLQAQASVDATDDYTDFFFTAEVVANSIPYDFSGNVMPGVMANITGSYDFKASVYDDGNGGFTGEISAGRFPVAWRQYILSFSTYVGFSWMPERGMEAAVESLEVSEINNAIPINPRIMLSGALNDYGFRIEKLAYSDSVSQLDGQGSLSWSYGDSGVETVVFALSAENPLGPERCDVLVNVSNPERLPFSLAAFRERFYFSATASVDEFPISRFFQNQNENNVVSAEFSALGTPADPFVTLNVKRVSATLVSSQFTAQGSGSLEDGTLSIADVNARWGAHELHDAQAYLSLRSYTGQADGEYFLDFGEKSITAPLSAVFISDGPFVTEAGVKGFPRSFVLTLSSSGCRSPAFAAPKPFSLRAVRRPGRFDVASTGSDSIAFWMLDTGRLDFKLGGALPVNLHAHGSIGRAANRPAAIDVAVDNIVADVSALSPFLDFGVFAAFRGIIEGNVTLGGLLADPDFDGALSLTGPEISSPRFAPSHFTADFVPVDISENIIGFQDVLLQSRDSGSVVFSMEMELNRWLIESVRLRFVTPDDTRVPVNMKLEKIRAQGDVNSDIDIEVRRDAVTVSGAIRAQNGALEITMMDFASDFSVPDTREVSDISINLKILVGPRMQVHLNTTRGDSSIGLNGLVAQGTEVRLLMETITDSFDIQGDVMLRGGEIIYFNRNFYLREGRIVFNETLGMFDPRITIRAETRDRDSDGAQVRIYLTATNQLLSQFMPVFTASPAKSEVEIMQILGQFVTGDSETVGDLVFSIVDWGVQMVVLRKIESGLREMLNFDIFSLRTMALQNVLRAQLDAQRRDKPITAGSMFDNSSLYAGKYFGSSIYADALLHMAYDENEILSGRSETGIVFQPELGLEIMSPYVNIRWSIAPELGKTDFLWVDATSITLSWKFDF
jgi:hypothetical protein